MRNSHGRKIAVLAIAVLVTTASCTNGRDQAGMDGATAAPQSDVSDAGAKAELG